MRTRVVISLICWFSSAYVLHLSFEQIYITARLAYMDSTKYTPAYSLIFFGVPWIALAVMNIGWIKNRRVHWVWVALGTVTGSLGVLFSFGIGVFYAPLTFILAIYLVYFNLSSKTPRRN
jgi:hypothetical protein